jgi:hypothetical protein
VLLIDDPFRFDDPDALAALVAVRNLAGLLHLQMEARPRRSAPRASVPARAAGAARRWPTRRRS